MDIDSEYRSWKQRAMCWTLSEMNLESADLWFPSDDFTWDAKEAAEICFECPARKECLKTSCDNKEPHGIWGGLPISIRSKRGRAHNFKKLVSEPNPYLTEDPQSPYYRENLGDDHE